MDPIQKQDLKLDQYEKKALKKIRLNNEKKQQYFFINFIIWIVIVSVIGLGVFIYVITY